MKPDGQEVVAADPCVGQLFWHEAKPCLLKYAEIYDTLV